MTRIYGICYFLHKISPGLCLFCTIARKQLHNFLESLNLGTREGKKTFWRDICLNRRFFSCMGCGGVDTINWSLILPFLYKDVRIMATAQSRVTDMTQGRPGTAAAELFGTVFLSNLLQQFYNLADTALAGHILGDVPWRKSGLRLPCTG